MEEALIWIPIAIAELLLLVSIALAIFLSKARKVERQLRLQIEELETARHRPAAAPPVVPPAARSEAGPADLEGADAYRQLEQLFEVAEAPEIDRSIEQLQKRLRETSECLQTVTAELEKEKTLTEHSQLALAELRENLKRIAYELTTLRHANARLQQELRSKNGVLEGTALGDQGSKERILLYIKRLRDELATLQLKLSGSEADVQRLRKEKEALVADHNALTLEYERLYDNFRK